MNSSSRSGALGFDTDKKFMSMAPARELASHNMAPETAPVSVRFHKCLGLPKVDWKMKYI